MNNSMSLLRIAERLHEISLMFMLLVKGFHWYLFLIHLLKTKVLYENSHQNFTSIPIDFYVFYKPHSNFTVWTVATTDKPNSFLR